MNRTRSVRTAGCNSALKREEILPPAGAQLTLQGVMLSESKSRSVCFHLRGVRGGAPFIETESRVVGARCWEGAGEPASKRCGISFGKMKTFRRWTVLKVVQQSGCARSTELDMGNGYNGIFLSMSYHDLTMFKRFQDFPPAPSRSVSTPRNGICPCRQRLAL